MPGGFEVEHRGQLQGTLTCVDRLIVHGHLSRLWFPNHMAYLLDRLGVQINRDFGRFVKQATSRVVARAQALAKAAGRPFLYQYRVVHGKDELARQIAAGICYFAQTNVFDMRRMRRYDNAGVWTTAFAAETGIKVTYLKEHFDGTKDRLWWAKDDTQTVGAYEAPAETSPGLVTAAPAGQQVGNTYERITGLEVYGEDEQLVVFKEGTNWWMKTSNGTDYYPFIFKIREYVNLMDGRNGWAHLQHNAYLYFSVLNGLQRYINSALDNIGPDRDNGLPSNRIGNIVALAGYAGRFYAAIDWGVSNLSSVMVHNGEGWHTVWIAPKAGKRIRAIFIQSIPGDSVDRLWIDCADEWLWMPISLNPYTHPLSMWNFYHFSHESHLLYSQMPHLPSSWES